MRVKCSLLFSNSILAFSLALSMSLSMLNFTTLLSFHNEFHILTAKCETHVLACVCKIIFKWFQWAMSMYSLCKYSSLCNFNRWTVNEKRKRIVFLYISKPMKLMIFHIHLHTYNKYILIMIAQCVFVIQHTNILRCDI